MNKLIEASCEQCEKSWKYAPEMTDVLHKHFCSVDCTREFFEMPGAGKEDLEYKIQETDFGISNL